MRTIVLKPTTHNPQLTSSQLRFNRLLNRIERLKDQLAEAQSVSDAHRPVYHQTIAPLRECYHSVMQELALWLDYCLQRKGLEYTYQQIATTVLCDICEQLAEQGYEEMQVLHDKHSNESLAKKKQDIISESHVIIESVLSKSSTDDRQLNNVSMEHKYHILEDTLEEYQSVRMHRKESIVSQRKAKIVQQEAENSFRRIFRQLASALHPDRENNSNERARKTNLMSEANAAYGRRDLVALLQIQLRTKLIDVTSIAKMAEEKGDSLTLLLKQQVETLKNELNSCHDAIRDEFCLQHGEIISAASLRRNLQTAEISLNQDLHDIQQDLQLIKNDNELRNWLIDQNPNSQISVNDDLKNCRFN